MAAVPAFKIPERFIKQEEDLAKWINSEAYVEFVGWIKMLGDAVRGKKVSDVVPESPVIAKLINLLDTLSKWVDETPPVVEEGQRFGNKSFRTWLNIVKPNSDELIKDILPDNLKGAVIELRTYFIEGFGNYTRIDYGTGHEAKFMAFLCCLMKIGVVPMEDAAAIVLRVSIKYIELVRKLQTLYRMEPAGSHGVWGLDDFQFIPFIWGAAQLIGNDEISPNSFVEAPVAEMWSKEYLFMSCINYINKVKTGPFYEHSNTLWSISAVSDWTKVNSGLLKMYKAEVLEKLPVVQHFPFGTILSIEPVTQ